MASLRIDHKLTENHNLFLRGNLTKGFQESAQLGALIGYSRGRSFHPLEGTVMVADTLLLPPKWVVETRLMFSYNRLHVIPIDPYGPEINVTGYGSFGRDRSYIHAMKSWPVKSRFLTFAPSRAFISSVVTSDSLSVPLAM